MTSTQVYGVVNDLLGRVGIVEGYEPPTKISQLANDSGFITSAGVTWGNIVDNPYPNIVSATDLFATAPGNRLIWNGGTNPAIGAQGGTDEYVLITNTTTPHSWLQALTSNTRICVPRAGRDMSPDGAGPEDVTFAWYMTNNFVVGTGYRFVGAGCLNIPPARYGGTIVPTQASLVFRQGQIRLPSALAAGTEGAGSKGSFLGYGLNYARIFKPLADNSANFAASGAALIVHNLGLASDYAVHITLRAASSGAWKTGVSWGGYQTDQETGGVISVSTELGVGPTHVINTSGVAVVVPDALKNSTDVDTGQIIPDGVVVWVPYRDTNSFWVAAIGMTTNATRLLLDVTISGYKTAA